MRRLRRVPCVTAGVAALAVMVPACTADVDLPSDRVRGAGSASDPASGTEVTGARSSRPPPTAPGVELRPVDGGPGYFGRWSNSFPTDPSFFPISVWAETLDRPDLVEQYRGLGINTFVNLWFGATDPTMDTLRAAGMYAVADPPGSVVTPAFDDAFGSTLAGRYFSDEPDLFDVCANMTDRLARLCRPGAGGRTSPGSIRDMADLLREEDPTRPVYGQFTKPVVLGEGLSEQDRRTYVRSADIVSFDWFVLTDRQNPGALWRQADAVRTVRDLAGYDRPVWPSIETAHTSDLPLAPEPTEVAAEVWNALIGGARGIGYFNHDFAPSTTSIRVLADPRFTDVQAAVKAVNARVLALAEVLNAPFAEGFVRGVPRGDVTHMAKAHGGSWYLFVAPRAHRSQQVTLDLADSDATTAEVLFEGRTVPLRAGRLTDDFADAAAVHVYRIEAD